MRNRSADGFASGAADFLATLNAIHPFRDGNGRAQLSFLALAAYRAGHDLQLDRLDPEDFLAAIIVSFHGDNLLLTDQLYRMVS